METTGTDQTSLVVLRGNSGSGKSTTARAVRARLGRGVAWVEQDHLRRIVLRERDVPGGANIGLIAQTVRYALDHDYCVLLEGILAAERYEGMLADLHRDHAGHTLFYYFDTTFEETVRRHATRPQATAFTTEQMAEWYRSRDLLGFVAEQLIPEDASAESTVERIVRDLAAGDAREPGGAHRGRPSSESTQAMLDR